MRGLLVCSALLVLTMEFASGQVVSHHPPRYARNYLIPYDVSSMAVTYPSYNVTSSDDYDYFGHSLLFLNSDDDTLIIGAKDQLYKLSDDLTLIQNLPWSPDPGMKESCITDVEGKGRLDRLEYECGNHIRVYRKFPDVPEFSEAQGRMLVCGSYSQDPRCITVDIDDITDHSSSVNVRSSGICSVHPDAPTFGDFQGNSSHYFTMGFSDDKGKDFPSGMYPVTYNASDKTVVLSELLFGIPSENHWITSKVEIIDFRVHNYSASGEVYTIFLRENGQTTSSTTGTVESRILRICRNDEGSESEVGSPSIKYFRSFTKARIVCRHTIIDVPSSTGINQHDWPALRAVAYTESESRFYGFNGIWTHLVYGVFSSQITAPNGTAICVYDIDEDDPDLTIKDYYTAYNIFRGSTFIGESSTAQSNKDFFNCGDPQRSDAGARQTLAVDLVGPYLENSYPLLEVDGVIGTKLATDTVCVRDPIDPSLCLVQDVLFMGTMNGRVMKIVITTEYAMGSGVLTQVEPLDYNDYDYVPVVAEEWMLDDSNEVLSLTVRKDFLYATTASRVYKFPTQACSRYSTCRACIGSQDPYCYWNHAGSTCDTFTHPNDDPLGSYTLPNEYYQNISSGEDPICDATPLCDLRCVSKNGGFDVEVDSCNYTETLSYRVSSACSGPNFIVMDDISLGDVVGGIMEINSDLILGHRLHTIDVIARSNSGLESTYSLKCQSAPTVPVPVTEEEILAIPVDVSQVDILVGLKACSITDEPGNYQITIEVDSPASTHSFNYVDQTSISVTSLDYCSSFGYSVVVKNSRGNVTYVPSTSASVVPPFLGVPTDVTVGSVTSRGATVSWIDPSSGLCTINGYSIYLNGAQVYRCLPLGSSTFTFTGLFPFLNYDVSVGACTTAGEGSLSAGESFTTMCEPPSRVPDLTLESRTSSSLQFTWSEPLYSNVTAGSSLRYTVESVCYDNVALSVNESTYSELTAPTLTLTSLPPLTLCCIKVFANADCLGGELSSLPVQVCNTTSHATPACPTNLIVNPTSYQSLLIQWDAPSNAILGLQYTVRVEPVDADSTASIPPQFSLDNTFAFVRGLQPNTTYRAHLEVDLVGGEVGGTGECISAISTTPVGPPPAPINVQLMSTDCTLIGSWSNPFNTAYNVTSYLAYSRCNDIMHVENVNDSMSVSFNVCDADNALELGGDLAWCSLQLQACDDLSCGELSELAVTVVPESRPARPNCFVTEDVEGPSVFITYTLSAPFALDELSFKYSLIQTSDSMTVRSNETMFNGSNVLFFDNLSRGQEYSFSLALCANDTGCGQSCNLVFTPNSTTPAYPRNVVCSVNSTAVTVSWEPPPAENINTIDFDVQLSGGGLDMERNVSVTNGGLSNTFSDLMPFRLYLVTVKTVDRNVAGNPGISSPASPAIECRTLSSKPRPLQFISGRVNMIGADTNTISLAITWQGPGDFNGNFSHYTFVWGNGTSRGRDPCQQLYDETADSDILMVPQYNLTSITVADRRLNNIVEAETIQLCGRVANMEFASDWLEENTNATTSGVSDMQTASTPLIAVIVLAVFSIVAAIVIAIILAIAIHARRNSKLTPTETMEEMKGSQNNHLHPGNIQRTMSTKPIIHEDEQDHSSDTSS